MGSWCSVNVMLKPFDWLNVPPLCFFAQNLVPKIARCTPVLGYKPSWGGERLPLMAPVRVCCHA